MNACLVSLLAVLPLAVSAADLPELVLPAGVGVNIHFTRGHEKDLDLIAAAGFKFIRMDFSWGGTERAKGVYNWADYDELTANLKKRGLRAYYILDYSNGLYEDTVVSINPVSGREQRDTASPSKPESIAAFARWAAAAAAHFKGRQIVWEIWNEPNISFWKPKPNVTNYSALVLATCKAVRAVDPQATILAPGSSEVPWEFIEHLFKDGALEHIDGVSVHPYRSYSKGPETALTDYRRLRALIERYAPPARRNLPIISGEWGYATHAKGGVALDSQAAFLARQQLANLYAGVPLSIWYDWKNDGPDASEREHNFGTVTLDLKPKPSYLAAQTLTRQLDGFRIARRLDGGSSNAWVLLLVNRRGEQKLAAWSTAGTSTEFIFTAKNLAPDDVSAVDIAGTAIAPEVTGGKLRLLLTTAPQYVSFKNQLPELTAAAAWRVGPDVASLIFAGRNDSLVVPVLARNPFTERALVRLRLTGLPGVPPLQIEKFILPGQSASHVFQTTVYERPADGFTGALVAEFLLEEKGDRFATLGRWSEPIEFSVANPIKLTYAPVADGLRVQIENPAREAFDGRLRAGSTDQPVTLTDARPDATHTLAGESTAARVELRDALNHLVATAPGATFRPLDLPRMKSALDGDSKVPAKANLALTNAPAGDAPYPRAWKLDYQFGAGWRFLRCEPVNAAGRWDKLPIKGRPSALGMWIYGDGSRNALRMRLADSAGQTFQPSGPNLTWQGWRWVTFDLVDLKHAGHWGGADDGVPVGELRLDCPLLVDGSRNQTSGTIYFTGMTWIFP